MNASDKCLSDLDQARKNVWAASDRLKQLVKSTFPPGRTVWYSHGRREVMATVVECHGERVEVEGASTGARYLIGWYRICGVEGSLRKEPTDA